MTQAQALVEFLDEETRRIAEEQNRPIAEARRLLLLAGIRAFSPERGFRMELPDKVLSAGARFAPHAGARVPRPTSPGKAGRGEAGRVLAFAARSDADEG
jgi:hypothetical protein